MRRCAKSRAIRHFGHKDAVTQRNPSATRALARRLSPQNLVCYQRHDIQGDDDPTCSSLILALSASASATV
jgi:hypothetical protein